MPAAAVRVPTFNLAFQPRFAAMSEEQFAAFAESKPLRKEFMLAMGRMGFTQKDMDNAMARLRRTYERMEREIRTSGGASPACRVRDIPPGGLCRAWPSFAHSGEQRGSSYRYLRSSRSLTPGPASASASMKITPPFSSARRHFNSVERFGSDVPFSKFLMVFANTPDRAAKSSRVHFRRLRAART
jgi:hypothetical protein